jgi:hypothetical protein
LLVCPFACLTVCLFARLPVCPFAQALEEGRRVKEETHEARGTGRGGKGKGWGEGGW